VKLKLTVDGKSWPVDEIAAGTCIKRTTPPVTGEDDE
jgi:hypothetical protein